MPSFMKSGRLRALAPLAATGPLLLATPALAGTAQHVKQSLGPCVADAPAGALCDFAYHEQTSFTQNTTRFFDDAGHLVRVKDHVDLLILHTNADTGQTLTERDQYAAHVDLLTVIYPQVDLRARRLGFALARVGPS